MIFHKITKSFIGLVAVLACTYSDAAFAGDTGKNRHETVEIANFGGSAISAEIPSGWKLQSYKGHPQIKSVKTGRHHFICLKSSGNTAFGIKKDIPVDLKRHPYMRWSWKAVRLPHGGDVRKKDTDDQALQIYLSFSSGRMGSVMSSPAISYIWDNLAPKLLKVKSPQPLLKNVRYVVMRNGTDKTGQWHTEKRNVYEDFKELFASSGDSHMPVMVKGVLLFINTHKTKGEAEGCIGNIAFTSE